MQPFGILSCFSYIKSNNMIHSEIIHDSKDGFIGRYWYEFPTKETHSELRKLLKDKYDSIKDSYKFMSKDGRCFYIAWFRDDIIYDVWHSIWPVMMESMDKSVEELIFPDGNICNLYRIHKDFSEDDFYCIYKGIRYDGMDCLEKAFEYYYSIVRKQGWFDKVVEKRRDSREYKKYRTTLIDFKFRLWKLFKRHKNLREFFIILDEKISSGSVDEVFYNKIKFYISMSNKELMRTGILDGNIDFYR